LRLTACRPAREAATVPGRRFARHGTTAPRVGSSEYVISGSLYRNTCHGDLLPPTLTSAELRSALSRRGAQRFRRPGAAHVGVVAAVGGMARLPWPLLPGSWSGERPRLWTRRIRGESRKFRTLAQVRVCLGDIWETVGRCAVLRIAANVRSATVACPAAVGCPAVASCMRAPERGRYR
jgi:hypothetical protein